RLAAKAGGVRFLLREPAFERIPVGLTAPRRAGTASATPVIEILHCVGGPTCAKGNHLVRALVRRFGGRARVELGDYWSGVDAVRLRHAIALRCADEQEKSWALLEHLAVHDGRATWPELLAGARAAGIDDRAFRACVLADRHLERITEDNLRADQLGLDLNILGIWVDGWRIDSPGDEAHVLGMVERVLETGAP
ncbi:MAG: thioredoxin domain-containing protein, partial [Kofleriaceae bacterium]